MEIIERGRNIAPTAAKPRQVISLLLFRRNTMVQTSELIDELWEGGPPASAMTTLQTYIYKLRKILMEHGGETILRTQPCGYMLTIPNSSIDLHVFEQSAQAGKALMEGGDAPRAAEVLRRALGMWRGAALVDVVQGELLSSYVTRLEELRFRALELRIEADLRLGGHRELISELKSLVLTHTLNEHLHASLMIALYRSGRRHEALETYRVLRGNMIEDLGLEPGPEVKQVHQALLADSPTGPPFEPGPQQKAVELIHHGGSATALSIPSQMLPARLTDAAVVLEPVPAELPPLDPAPPAAQATLTEPVIPPAQLPPDLADFTGREKLMDEIAAGLLAEDEIAADRTATGLVAITGMPGVGKTAFAVHLAHRLRGGFPDGQLYTELHGASSAGQSVSETLHGFLRALGVPDTYIPDALEERGKMLRSITTDKRLLVVIDDAGSQADVSPLLPGGSQCAVIVTSRRWLFELGGRWDINLRVLDEEEAVELLARMIGPDRVAREPVAASRLVELAGRLPLALRCLGGRLTTMPGLPIAKMAEQLARSSRRLDLLRIGRLNVHSTFDSAYEGLGEVEQRVFRLLSALPVTEFTASATADLLGLEEPEAQHVLEQLGNHHLITMCWADGEVRYAFPELTRAYAWERLTSALDSRREPPSDDPARTGPRGHGTPPDGTAVPADGMPAVAEPWTRRIGLNGESEVLTRTARSAAARIR
ncbi:BTAD domain-containing putative transcriptional regulator [Nonomuraea sp. NPDC046570]|uniref:AfsR/SARP family transcriptional regulator n=1 Tax=Nonomuraea sp. NPDC046570 TaxID=3155255 RepID=UPI0033DFB9B3